MSNKTVKTQLPTRISVNGGLGLTRNSLPGAHEDLKQANAGK